MGLLILPARRSAVKSPELTAFGRVVLLEDPYLKTEITQWLAHLNLCAGDNGAEVWYQTFWNGAARLGLSLKGIAWKIGLQVCAIRAQGD
jgi:hypothetical protein